MWHFICEWIQARISNLISPRDAILFLFLFWERGIIYCIIKNTLIFAITKHFIGDSIEYRSNIYDIYNL